MTPEHLREVVDAKLDAITDKLDLVLAKQDTTNGRVRKAEIAVAVLQWGYGLGAFLGAAWFAWFFSINR